ncbi:hypothetical protein V6Z12_D04G134000 [Gossypium hirsutum]
MQDLIPPHPYSPDATKYNFPLSTSRFARDPGIGPY